MGMQLGFNPYRGRLMMPSAPSRELRRLAIWRRPVRQAQVPLRERRWLRVLRAGTDATGSSAGQALTDPVMKIKVCDTTLGSRDHRDNIMRLAI